MTDQQQLSISIPQEPVKSTVVDIKSAASEKYLHLQPLQVALANVCLKIPILVPNENKRSLLDPSRIQQDRQILTSVNGIFQAGRLTAVMGASGAGKTSLLNVLSGELPGSAKVSGTVRVNGMDFTTGRSSSHRIKDISGFVFQDDVILDTMTVREAILMSARLRLPQSISLADKVKMVDSLLELLHLEKCRNTIIGSTLVKGVSGGERKRTAIAMEMVTNPSLLFLDEPTSGLDTYTAYNVVDILKKLCKTGRTVIATIHQPSSDTFHLFDDLCLLSEGRVLYFGPVDGVVEYFSRLGYQCPTYSNPADYAFMSIINAEAVGSVLTADEKTLFLKENLKRITGLLDKWDSSLEAIAVKKSLQVDSEDDKPAVVIKKKYVADFPSQFAYLMGRAFRNALRNKFIVKVKFAQAMFIALLVGLIYFDLPSKGFKEQNQNRSGALFFISINMFMSSSIGILSIFSAEKTVFRREYQNGYYSLPAYFFSKILVELPVQVVFPIIQSVIIYYMVGLNTNEWYKLPTMFITLILLASCGQSMGIFFASVFKELTVALAVTPVAIIPLMIFSGLFVNNNSIPVYFDWIKYISPIKWGFEALVKNEYTDLTLTNEEGIAVGGDQMIKDAGFDDGFSIGNCLTYLFAIYIALLSLAFLALWRNVQKK